MIFFWRNNRISINANKSEEVSGITQDKDFCGLSYKIYFNEN